MVPVKRVTFIPSVYPGGCALARPAPLLQGCRGVVRGLLNGQSNAYVEAMSSVGVNADGP